MPLGDYLSDADKEALKATTEKVVAVEAYNSASVPTNNIHSSGSTPWGVAAPNPNYGGMLGQGSYYPPAVATTLETTNYPRVKETCRCGGKIDIDYEESTFRLLEEWLSRHADCPKRTNDS